MAIKDTDRKARANYKKKVTTIRVELYGTDEDIKEHIERMKDFGESVQAYIKDLIRADMKRKRHEPLVDRATYTRVQEKLKEQTETAPAPLPLGYKMQDGKIVIDEEEAEIVNRAAEEMARAGRLSAETEKRIRKLMEKRHEQNQEVVMGETMARAEREAALLRCKDMLEAHKKWKAAHPRRKKTDQ